MLCVFCPAFYAGTTSNITPRTWSTVVGANEPYLSVIIGNNFVTGGTWDPTIEKLVITPVFAGTATIQLEIRKNGVTLDTHTLNITVHLPVENGIYFFKNAGTGDFMQIDDADSSNNYATAGAIIELHDIDGGNHQRWQLTHMYSGYYTIKSVQSNKYVSVQDGDENSADKILVQEASLGPETSRKFWKITKTSRGTYTGL